LRDFLCRPTHQQTIDWQNKLRTLKCTPTHNLTNILSDLFMFFCSFFPFVSFWSYCTSNCYHETIYICLSVSLLKYIKCINSSLHGYIFFLSVFVSYQSVTHVNKLKLATQFSSLFCPTVFSKLNICRFR
jgi:uncharacterized membrane protein SirB2